MSAVTDQAQILQNKIFADVQAGVLQFLQSDFGVVTGGILSIAFFLFMFSVILQIINNFRDRMAAESSSREQWATYGESVIEETVIQEEVDELDILDRKIKAANHAGDSGRVAIYKKRQSMVVNSAAKKLGRLHFRS